MEQGGSNYHDVLCLAQSEGYAEADPTMDVDGTDATQKLAILAHLAFGQWVPWASIPRFGLETIDQELLRFADELGCRIRVVADASRGEETLSLRVGPALVRKGTPLAETQGAFNAVSVVGNHFSTGRDCWDFRQRRHAYSWGAESHFPAAPCGGHPGCAC